MNTITVTDENAVAKKLRKCYEFERKSVARSLGGPANYRVPRCWDIGSRGNPEARGASIWLRLIRLCERHKIDPFRYVQWCLDVDQVLLDLPREPNQLLASSRIKAFCNKRPKQVEAMRNALLREKDHAEAHFAAWKATEESAEDVWAYVLLNDASNLSPLFRYVVASRIGGERFRKIAGCFEKGALLQYHYAPDAYGQGWSTSWLPPWFAERAAELYDQLLEGSLVIAKE